MEKKGVKIYMPSSNLVVALNEICENLGELGDGLLRYDRVSRPFSASDAKNIGSAEVYHIPRLLAALIWAEISKIIGWADEM
jgi:hypothetical protein